MAEDKIITSHSERQVGNKMTDCQIDIMDIPVVSEVQIRDMRAGESVIVLDIPEISEYEVRDIISEKKVGVPEILETSELQFDDMTAGKNVVVLDIPETSEYEVQDIISEKKVGVPEILETSELQIGDTSPYEKILESSKYEVGDILAEKKIDILAEYEVGDILADKKIDVPETSELEFREMRRYSINRAFKICSRYLKASRGSCHDLCKGVMRNLDEENSRSPKFKRSTILKTVRESLTLAWRNRQSASDIITTEENPTSRKFKRSITFQGPRHSNVITSMPEGNAKNSKSRKSVLGLQNVRETVTFPRKNVLLLDPTPSLDSESHDPSFITNDDLSSMSEETSRSLILKSRIIHGKGLGLETVQETQFASDYSNSDRSVITSEVTSLYGKSTLSSKNGLSSLKLKTVNSKPASGTSGSLKNVTKLGKPNSPVLPDSRRKTDLTGKAKNVWVPPSVSSPRRSHLKSSVANFKNENSSVKLKPVRTSRVDDVPAEKTLYIIESSVNTESVELAPVDLSPRYSPSSRDKNSKRAQNGIGTGRSPPPIDKKSLQLAQNRSLIASSPKKKVSRPGSTPVAQSSPRCGRNRVSFIQNETEINRQKVHLRKTLATTRLLPPSSLFSEKIVLRRTNYGNPASPRSSAPTTSTLRSPYSGRSTTSFQYNESEISSVEKLNLKSENKSRTRKIAKDEDLMAHKLNFRRGRVIEPQCDVVVPRQSKFRRRVIVENTLGKGDDKKIIFAKKGDNESNEVDSTSSSSSKKVTLKHQEVSQKRDAKILFNNVIEETASKLVQTRKSKVKALVDAFETVILLNQILIFR